MKLDTKAALKDYIPPAVIKLFYFLGLNRYGWFGDYSSWEEWQWSLFQKLVQDL